MPTKSNAIPSLKPKTPSKAKAKSQPEIIEAHGGPIVDPLTLPQRLAAAADRYGFHERDVLKHADLVAEWDLQAATPADVEEAQGINSRRVRHVADKLGANRPAARENEPLVAPKPRKVSQRKVDIVEERVAGGAVKPTEEAPAPAPEKKKAPAAKKVDPTPKANFHGFAPTAVIRALGKAGWKLDEVTKAVAKFAPDLSPSTIKIQLSAGVKGERGDPAPLSKAQLKELR